MTNEEFAQNTADDLYNTGLSIENQITLAQVHATLALVEQQRQANILAMFNDTFSLDTFLPEVWEMLSSELREIVGVSE